jgi:hypothetical protein
MWSRILVAASLTIVMPFNAHAGPSTYWAADFLDSGANTCTQKSAEAIGKQGFTAHTTKDDAYADNRDYSIVVACLEMDSEMTVAVIFVAGPDEKADEYGKAVKQELFKNATHTAH